MELTRLASISCQVVKLVKSSSICVRGRAWPKVVFPLDIYVVFTDVLASVHIELLINMGSCN